MSDSTTSVPELPSSGFLAGVSAEHRAFLGCFGKFLRPADGAVLIEEGQAQDSLYVALTGQMHVLSAAGNRQVLLAKVSEGESIGEINLFDPGKASATVIARGTCVIWTLSHEELDSFLAADPLAGVGVLKGLLAQMARRIRSTNEKLLTAEQRASFHEFWSSASR